MRVALLTNILPPYRLPVFRELARTPGWQLRVFLNATSEWSRDWDVDFGGLDVELVRGAALRRGDDTLHLPFSLLPALVRFAPDAIVSGELGARTALAALYAAAARVPLVAWVEGTRARAAASGRLRRCVGPLLLSRARSAVVPGGEARRLLRAWGVPEHEWDTAYAVVDPDGVGPRLFFQKVPEGKTAKNRLHLDVRVSDPATTPAERDAAVLAEVERLEAEGARRVEWRPDMGRHFMVMQDVEGNEFCVT